MNQQWMKQLFSLGHSQTVIIDRLNAMRSDESLFIHLGNRFAAADKSPPKYIYLDDNHVVCVSEDLIKTYGVFELEETLTLIDEYGQFCKFRNYPSSAVLEYEVPSVTLTVIDNSNEFVS